MMDELKQLAREKRGFITETDIAPYLSVPDEDLKWLLACDHSQKRTIAAMLIGKRRIISDIPLLCHRLCIERSLYPRIAISEALGEMGEAAVRPLIALLGKIGNNQEVQLPARCCRKRSFPLARDLAARTLVKIGRPALPELIRELQKGDSFENQQAVDAIGGIVSKTGDYSPLPVLLQVLTDNATDQLMVWKIIRALSAFRSPAVFPQLCEALRAHPQAPIRWEAAISLGRIGICQPEIIEALQNGLRDVHSEVRIAAALALKQLKCFTSDR